MAGPETLSESRLAAVPYGQYADAVREKPQDFIDAEIEKKATGSVLTLNDAKLLSTGPEAFKDIEQAILWARTSIDINIFSWASDSTGLRVAELLVKAKGKNPKLNINVQVDKLGSMLVGSKEGFKKKSFSLLRQAVDKLGSDDRFQHLEAQKMLKLLDDPTAIHDFTDEEKKELELFVSELLTEQMLLEINPALKILKDAGINLVIENNGLGCMDHSKVFIFDKQTTYSGGMNIGDDYSGGYEQGKGWTAAKKDYWKDYMVGMKGPVANISRHNFFGQTQFAPDKLQWSPARSPIRVLYTGISA